MDKLAKVIHAGIWSGSGLPLTSIDACRDIAAAVRAHLLSDDAVERAAQAMAHDMGDVDADYWAGSRQYARAAITALLETK